MARANVIPSGIEPASVDRELLDLVAQIESLFRKRVLMTLHAIQQAEADCLARLHEYTPTERLLDIKEAAAYLKYAPRTLDSWTRPGCIPKIPFILLGGEKRFRKTALDSWLDRQQVAKQDLAARREIWKHL